MRGRPPRLLLVSAYTVDSRYHLFEKSRKNEETSSRDDEGIKASEPETRSRDNLIVAFDRYNVIKDSGGGGGKQI